MMPHAVVLVAIALAFRYNRTGKLANVWWAVAAAIAVGGSSYFSSLLLFMVYAVMMCITVPKEEKCIAVIAVYLLFGRLCNPVCVSRQ